MRFWPPYVDTVLAELADTGCRHLLGIILSPFQCAASWEHYQQSVADGVAALGQRAPQVTYLSPWHTQAGFVEAIADGIEHAAASLGGAWLAAGLVSTCRQQQPVERSQPTQLRIFDNRFRLCFIALPLQTCGHANLRRKT